jgi:hypothetical protein
MPTPEPTDGERYIVLDPAFDRWTIRAVPNADHPGEWFCLMRGPRQEVTFGWGDTNIDAVLSAQARWRDRHAG